MTDWYEKAVIYAIDVERFKDGDANGWGDFAGLTESLDYIEALGVDSLWLLPIFDTPNRDNGYDVRDYLKLDPRLGTLDDFTRLVEKAGERGMRVVIDLPVNHTSIDHPWFREGSRDRASEFHHYYIWADRPPDDGEERLIFGGQQGGNWDYAEGVDKFYYHTFYPHQADLNFSNPKVRHEIGEILRFWLARGVSGFRLDAVAYMVQTRGDVHFEGDPHEGLRQLRALVEDESPAAVLVAEVDEEPDELAPFFGKGDELHMILNFYLCNFLFLALARGDGEPLRRALGRLPDPPDRGRWANFVRNHDELDLERLDRPEFDEVIAAFGPEERMQAYGRGIRRRLAPMLGDDRRRLELTFSLLLTLPGTPVLLYGDEIGMGDDLSFPDRDAVRTLMQWSRDRHGGFSAAAEDRLVRPPLTSRGWGFVDRNVADQRADPDSLWNWMARALRVRRDHPELALGDPQVLDLGDSRLFGIVYRTDDAEALAVHNLSRDAVVVDLPFPASGTWRQIFPEEGAPDSRVTLGPSAYLWLATR